MLHTDIDPESRCRLPLVTREVLGEKDRHIFDALINPNGGTIRGLKGPAGILLHNPALFRATRPAGRYLHFEAPESPRIRETAILITVRICDSRFEWAAHEPAALSAGVPEKVIDVINHMRQNFSQSGPLRESRFRPMSVVAPLTSKYPLTNPFRSWRERM